MGSIISDILATTKNTFRIALATLSATGLTAARTLAIPNRNGTLALADDAADPSLATILRDEFIGGSNETGELGELGWSFTNGSAAGLGVNEQGHPGCLNRTSGTTASQIASLLLGPNTVAAFRFDEFDECTWIFRATAANTDCAYLFGIMAQSGVTSAHALYLERLATDTNWFFVSRNNSAQTRTDSGVAFGTGWLKVRMRRVGASEVAFSINGGAEVSITTNVPDAADTFVVAHHLTPTATTARTVYIDFFSLKLLAIAR